MTSRRMTIRISERLHQAVKNEAKRRGQSMSDRIAAILAARYFGDEWHADARTQERR